MLSLATELIGWSPEEGVGLGWSSKFGLCRGLGGSSRQKSWPVSGAAGGLSAREVSEGGASCCSKGLQEEQR